MFKKYEFRKMTHIDKKRDAWFWYALGNFLGSTLLLYVTSSILSIIIFILIVIKLISNV
jgi:hypothetical protein